VRTPAAVFGVRRDGCRRGASAGRLPQELIGTHVTRPHRIRHRAVGEQFLQDSEVGKIMQDAGVLAPPEIFWVD
jgi:hypothetical protein